MCALTPLNVWSSAVRCWKHLSWQLWPTNPCSHWEAILAISPLARVSAPLFLHPNIAPDGCFGNQGVGLSGSNSPGLCLPPCPPPKPFCFPEKCKWSGSHATVLSNSPSGGRLAPPGPVGSTVAPVGYHSLALSDPDNPFSLGLASLPYHSGSVLETCELAIAGVKQNTGTSFISEVRKSLLANRFYHHWGVNLIARMNKVMK